MPTVSADSVLGVGTGAGSGGASSTSGLAIYYGRPLLGGTGGIYQRALNDQPGVPFQPPVGSGVSGRDVSTATFQSLDSLIIRYVDDYLQTVPNRDTSGSTTVSFTGIADAVGTYNFSATVSYNYQETGNPTSTFNVNDTDSMSYTFHEVGVGADGVSFTLNDNGSANSSSKYSPTGATSCTYTLTNVLSGSSTYTLIEGTTQSGTLGTASEFDSFSLQHKGSDSYTLNEHLTVTVSSVDQYQSAVDASTFSETDNDSWTSVSLSQNAGGGAITGGTESLTDTGSLTDSGSSNSSLTMTATDSLNIAGAIASGSRSFSYGSSAGDTSTLYSMDTDSVTLAGGGSTYESDTLTTTDTETLSQTQTGTETYSATADYYWNETATDSLSSSESDSVSVTGSSLETANIGGVTSSATTAESDTDRPTLIDKGTITQTMAQNGAEVSSSETVTTAGETDTWNESGAITSTLSDTEYGASTSTLTTSSTLGGVTDTATTTLTDAPQSTLTETGTDTLSLYETGHETLSGGGLATAGVSTQTLTDSLSGGLTTGHTTDSQTETVTEYSNATLGGQTTTETFFSNLTANTTVTPTENDSSSSTFWTTDSLGAGGAVTSGTDTQTLFSQSTLSQTLGVTTTEKDTDSFTESDSLGGVTTTDSLTDSPTTTETDGQTITYTDTQTATSSLTTSAGAVTGGGGHDSLYETSSDTHTSQIISNSPASSLLLSSSNLAGTSLNTTLSDSTADNSTLTITGNGTSAEVGTDTEVQGTLGLVSSGGSYDSASYSMTDSHSLTDVETDTQSESDTLTATAGGVSTSDTIHAFPTSTIYSTLAGNDTDTQTATSTLTYGTDGVVDSGSDTLWDTLTDGGSESLSATLAATTSETDTVTSSLGGVTTTAVAMATETDSSSGVNYGPYSEVSTESSNDTLGPGGFSTAGADIQYVLDQSTLTASGSDQSTITTKETTTLSSSLSGITSTESLTSTSTLTATASDPGTITSTDDETATTSYGSGGLITGGNDTLWDTITDSGSQTLYSTGPDTITATSNAYSTVGNVTITVNATSTETDSTTLSQWGPYQDTSTESSNDTLGANGYPSGGSDAQTGWDLSTVTLSDSEPGTVTSTQTTTESSTLSNVTATDSVTATDTLFVASTDSATMTPTETQTATTTLGSGDVITGGGDFDSLYETGSDSSPSTVTDYGHSLERGQSYFADGNTTISDSYSETLAGTPTLTTAEGSNYSATDTATLTLGSNGVVSSGRSSDSLYQTGWDTDTLTGTTTETESDYSSVSDSTSNASSYVVTNVTATSTLTSSESDSLSSTIHDSDTATIGSNATISTGCDTVTDTSSGYDTFYLYETDSDSSNVTGGGTTSLGLSQATSTLSEHLTSSPTITDWGDSTNSSSSLTESETVGANGVASSGTATFGDLSTLSATYTLSEVTTTTLSESSSDGVGASANSSSDQSLGTGTLTDTSTLSEPSTLTATDGGNLTVGVSDVVSGGTSSDSLYETSNDSQNDIGADTLTTTATTSDSLANSGAVNQGSLTTTSTLVDSSTDNSGGPVTQTESDATTLGSNAVVSGGGGATTLWAHGSDSYSLYETGQETYSSGGSLAQGGVNGYSQSNGYAGSGRSTLTTTENASSSSTETATTTLGTNATISGGSSTESLYETSNDTNISSGSGTKVRVLDYGGAGGDSSTFTVAYSSSDSAPDFFTDTLTDIQTLGANGTISSGQDFSTLTSHGSDTDTYTEDGSRSINVGSTGTIGGSYSDSESTSDSYTLSDSTSLSIGSGGSIAGGTLVSLTTQTYSDTQSDYESGNETMPDPTGGVPYNGTFSQTSVATSEAYSTDNGTVSLGAYGSIAGGANTFTSTQSETDSLSTSMWDVSLTSMSASINDLETDAARYSDSMTGVENYAAGGGISGGADAFVWTQSANDSDSLVLSEASTTTSPSSYTFYNFTEVDHLQSTLTDSGSDVLGAGDSIASNGDTYTITDSRLESSSFNDTGSSAAPYLIVGFGMDTYSMSDVGSSSLSASGQVYGLDTVSYYESSSETASDTDNYSGAATPSLVTASAVDVYIDNDLSTITNSNGTTTSYDTYTLTDTHSLNGYVTATVANSSEVLSSADSGYDENIMVATGTASPTTAAMTFSESDNGSDLFGYTEATNSWNASGGDDQYSENSMTGTNSGGSGGDTYNYTQTNTLSTTGSAVGTQTLGGMHYPIDWSSSATESLVVAYSSPPQSSHTVTSVSQSTNSGSNGVMGGPSEPTGGGADTEGAGTAGQLGDTAEGAIHNGSDNRGFDLSEGLVSALGGQDVHGLEFAGGEEQPMLASGSFDMEDFDGTDSGGPPTTPWQSHPSSLGYVRGNQGGGGSGDPSEAEMDSGTRDGTTGQELTRLSNFGPDGTEQNPTAAQPGPESRAQQQAATPAAMSAGSGGPSAGGNNASSSAGSNPSTPGTQAMASATAPAQLGPASASGGAGGGTGTPAAASAPGSYYSDAQGGGQRRAQDHGTTSAGPGSPGPDNPGTPADQPGSQTPPDPADTPKPPTQTPGASKEELKGLVLDLTQLGLDLGGTFEPTPFCDLSNAGISACRGDWWGVGSSLLGVVPYVGDLAKVGRLGKHAQSVSRAIGLAAKNADVAKLFRPVFKKLYDVLNKIPLDSLPPSVARQLRNLRDQLGEFLNKRKNSKLEAGGCFIAGTPILTPEGSTPIEQIQPGDWVLTAPDHDLISDPVPRQVESIFENFMPTLDLHVNGRAIRTTAEHPFWVEFRGWVDAQQLEAGDRLRAHDGRWLGVDRVEGPKEAAPVYNICVSEYHTYFIGHQTWGFSVWSHNMSVNGCAAAGDPGGPKSGGPDPGTGNVAPNGEPGPWKGPTDYSSISDPKDVTTNTKPTPRQVREMKRLNREQNGGVLRDDVTGEVMQDSAKSTNGVTPPANEAQVDHVFPESLGGSRSSSNLNLRTRQNNRAKWDTPPEG